MKSSQHQNTSSALGRVPVGETFFHYWMMEAALLTATFNAGESFLHSSPDLCLDTILCRTSTDGSLDFMVCALTGSYKILYRQAVASQIMASQKDLLFLFLLLVNLQEYYTNFVSTLSLWGIV